MVDSVLSFSLGLNGLVVFLFRLFTIPSVVIRCRKKSTDLFIKVIVFLISATTFYSDCDGRELNDFFFQITIDCILQTKFVHNIQESIAR